jgi:hypothetical protein
MPDDGMSRNDDDFAISRVVVHREGWDDVDVITNCEVAHVLANCVDVAGSLIAETSRKLDRLNVVVDPPHGFGAVDANRLDSNADLIWTGEWNFGLDELKNLGPSGPCESNRA